MDLEKYVAEELAEERALGQGLHDHQRGAGAAYPGDPDVEISPDTVETRLLNTDVGGITTRVSAVSSPEGEAPAPGVVVIHENKGLVPYIENTARRLASRGFVAAAPDLLAGQGGTSSFGTAAAATEALRSRDPGEMVSDLRNVLSALASDPRVDPARLGVVGFCFGGGLAWRMLAAEPRLSAGVPFYGPPPPADRFANIAAPVLAVYGETDERITSTLPATRKEMSARGRDLQVIVLPGAGHAFHNDSNPDRYEPVAARTAWEHTLSFLAQTLHVRLLPS